MFDCTDCYAPARVVDGRLSIVPHAVSCPVHCDVVRRRWPLRDGQRPQVPRQEAFAHLGAWPRYQRTVEARKRRRERIERSAPTAPATR